jgi:phosphate transport system substrate-binding protein
LALMPASFPVTATVLISPASALAAANEPAIHLRGSGNLMAVAQQAAEAYMREHTDARIVVSGGGTQRGYKALIGGTTDIAMTSSALSEEMSELLNAGQVKLVTTTIGFVAMVPILHRDNAVVELTEDHLRDIFTGRISNFDQVGGLDKAIEVYIGSPGDGLTESWRAALIDSDDHHTPRMTVLDAKERLARVATDPAAISFVSAADVDSRVKAVTVNGRAADDQSVRDGTYRLVAPLTLVTTAHAPKAVKDYVAYVSNVAKDLRSPAFIAAVDAQPITETP